MVRRRVVLLPAALLAAGLPLAGAALAAVPASFFLMGCAYLLALFLVVGKRQWELQNAGGASSSSQHRPALAAYGTWCAAMISIRFFLRVSLPPGVEPVLA